MTIHGVCIFPLHVRFQQWPRWLSKHHTRQQLSTEMTTTSNRPTPKCCRVQISAQTGTDGCVRKQNTDNEPFLPLPFNFLSVFINGYTKRKITSNGQFWITQRLSHLSHSIFQSTFFHVNITTNKL